MAMNDKDTLTKKLASVKKNLRELRKQEKALKEERLLEKDMSKWQTIMDAQAACNEIMREADFGRRLTLKQLAVHPTFYIYQHPHNKKLRTSDINVNWVQAYIGDKSPDVAGGRTGSIEDLLATARQSTLRTWKRINKKKKKSGDKKPDVSIKTVLNTRGTTEGEIRGESDKQEKRSGFFSKS